MDIILPFLDSSLLWLTSIPKRGRLSSSEAFETHAPVLQVMAVNLMSLEGKRTTVAVVGLAHVDGIEAILAANGWNLQRC